LGNEDPAVWQGLGVAAFVVIGVAVVCGVVSSVSTPFLNRRSRNERIEEAREQGGQEAVDRFVKTEAAYQHAEREQVKKAVVEGIVGSNNVEKVVGVGVAVFVIVAALIALTR